MRGMRDGSLCEGIRDLNYGDGRVATLVCALQRGTNHVVRGDIHLNGYLTAR